MGRKFIVSDTHFRHQNIISFEAEARSRYVDGPFQTVDEHDEHVIERWNLMVSPEDTVYHLGDVAFNVGLPLVGRLNGKKILVMGNHDGKGALKYLEYFHEIYGCFGFRKWKALATHYPVHPSQLEERYAYNIHGHVHSKTLSDTRYINVSMENVHMAPIDLELLMDGKDAV